MSNKIPWHEFECGIKQLKLSPEILEDGNWMAPK